MRARSVLRVVAPRVRRELRPELHPRRVPAHPACGRGPGADIDARRRPGGRCRRGCRAVEEGANALLMVPLVARGETIGVAEITRAGRRFGSADMALAASYAAEAAMALENARLHEELRRQAFHDGLTRLANRALFTDRLNHALARVQRGPARVAVLFADIDRFKSVNDQLGHVRGDQVLARRRGPPARLCAGRGHRGPAGWRRVRRAPGGPHRPRRG